MASRHVRFGAVARRLLAPVLAVAVAGCGGSSTGTVTPPDTTPASLAVVAGDGQSGWITQSLAVPLVVRVANAAGAGLSGVPVTWAVAAGGGSLFPASSATAANGRAEVSLALGPAAGSGNNAVTASVAGLPPVTFHASAVAWRSLTIGTYHACALTTTDAAWCWGPGGHGELGTGDSLPRTSPARVATDLLFTRLSAGAAHTCGLTAAGEAYCWGWNPKGQLGDGGTTTRLTPVRAAGALTFTDIGTGQEHTCGLTVTGAVYCWGGNTWGQLGVGDTLPHAGPVAVGGGHGFASLTVGLIHSCALTPGGAAYCWGAETYANGTRLTTPTAVPGGVVFAAIRAGVYHTCGVTAANVPYCWGVNDQGGLGDGTLTTSTAPVAVSGGGPFAAVAAGAAHSCGLSPSGAAWCWGWGFFGQLGSGDFPIRSTIPVAVSGGLALAGLVAGGDHACALTATGLAYCWGENSLGTLGDGTRDHRAVPTRVSMP